MFVGKKNSHRSQIAEGFARIISACSISAPECRHSVPSLNLVAQLLTNGSPLFNQRRQALRYKHTAAIRAALVKNYEPATVNRILCAKKASSQGSFKT